MSSASSLVITLIGPDRPGLVGKVSDVIRQHGGNWLESRMAHLAGQFAGIILVEVPDVQADTLAKALQSLQQQGLKLVVERDLILTTPGVNEGAMMTLSVIGNDRPGIVREVSQVLAERNVNVEEFSTQCSDAPMSGGRIFQVNARLRLPADITMSQLQHQLEQVTVDLMVDISPREKQH